MTRAAGSDDLPSASSPVPWPLRLLVDLPNWVGDQVMALPVVERLVAANCGGATVLHVRPAMARLLAALFPNTTVVASRPKTSPLTAAARVLTRAGRSDLGLTLRHAARAKIFLRLAASTAWGSRGGFARTLLDRSFPIEPGRHQRLDAAPMLEALGLPLPDPAAAVIRLPASLAEEGAALLGPVLGGPETRVGLAPAARGGPSKRWPVEHFGELAGRLLGEGLAPVVVVGPGEEEVAQEVVAAVGRPLPAVGASVDVAGLAGLLAQLDVLVCNDSGPMHLAAAVGTPVVALFGPTDPGRTGPAGDRTRVLATDLGCAPCGQACCPLAHQRCLRDQSVDRVLTAVLEILGRD